MPLKSFHCSIRISLLFWTICLLPVNALADKPKGYKLFNQSDGLVFNYVNDMVRDRDGHVWLATERGLFRFDGCTYCVRYSAYL